MKTKLLSFVLVLLGTLSVLAQPGQLDLTFNPAPNIGAYGGSTTPPYSSTAECIVYRSKIYESGPDLNKIIIVGRFTSFNGVARKYVARLLPNGTLDTSFVGPAFSSGFLYSAEILPDGKILVCGDFTVGGYSRLCRLNSDGSLDTTYNPSPVALKGGNDWILSLCVLPDGRVLAGGRFTTFNGTTGKRLVRLLEDGTVDPTFTGTGTVNGEVRAICMQNDKILVGGFFTGFTGYANKNKIVRLNDDGSYDPTFNASGNGATGGTGVFDIVTLEGKIFIGGKFDYFNGVNKRAIARLNADGTLDTDFNVGNIGVTNPETNTGSGAGYNVFAICIQPDGKLLLGGNFTQYNGVNIPKGLARIYQDGSRDLTFVTGTGFTGGTLVYEGKSVVRHMALQSDGRIVVGGDFTEYNGISRRMAARIITRDCDSSTQYLDGSGWADENLPDTSDELALIYSGSYTIASGTHLVCCDLQINPGASLIISSDASLTVHGNIVNNGTFIVEDNGSLVQTKDDATYTNTFGGIFIAKRSTAPVRRYDYTYWSSPVQNFTLYSLSPNTLADKYFKFNTPLNTWTTIMNGAETMGASTGYIVRAPQTFSTTVPAIYTALFTGRPNNGVISHTTVLSGSNWNLMGNPYPSALDINAFLAEPANAHVNGTIYLWTHITPPTFNGQYYLYTSDDYATYNSLGYVTPGGFSPTTFDGKVASGQSFFIEAASAGTVYFNNSMRVATGNDQFFRLNASASQETALPGAAEKNRFWLNLANSQGAFNQTLIGYATGATNGFDRDFDGRTMSGNYVSLYSLNGGEKFTIQGRALPFDKNDVVTLGYKSTIAGTFKISIDHRDGFFLDENTKIYLKDKQLNVLHNLSQPYEFTTTAGQFENRFEIVYKQKTNPANVSGQNLNQLVTTVNGNALGLQATRIMQEVVIFDAGGREISRMPSLQAASAEITNLQKNNSLLLLLVTYEDGTQETAKVLF